jgi:hypothetical protein
MVVVFHEGVRLGAGGLVNLFRVGFFMGEPQLQVDHARLAGFKSSCSSAATDLGQSGFGPRAAAEYGVL